MASANAKSVREELGSGNRMVKNILIETGLGNGIAEYGNVGDISMLQVAVARLQGFFPDAQIQVLTDSAENLARFCPGARPLNNRGRTLWFGTGVLLGRYTRSAPRWLLDLLVVSKRIVRSRCPRLVTAIAVRRLNNRNRPADTAALKAFSSALQTTDALVICGAGGFYDGCQSWNLDILDLLEEAIQRNIPVAMLGQGFGPLEDPVVLRRAAKVLPRVNFITLRGNRGALALLCSLGVAGSSIEITGDEALELAYESRSEDRGQALGINLRFAGSASTDDDDIKSVRGVLQDFATQHSVPLIPLPIAMHAYSRDDLTILQLMTGVDEQSDGGKNLDTPQKVIKQAALCRVVVTGAYHAAVFALAQGIPVVGLAKSAYFSSKFFGLGDQFGEGCQTVLLNDPDLPQRLRNAVESAWQNADKLRDQLQAAARERIQSSRQSYERLSTLATSAKACRNKRSAAGSAYHSDLPQATEFR